MTLIQGDNGRSDIRDRALRHAAVSGLLGRVLVLGFGFASFAVCARSLDSASFGVLAVLSSLGLILAVADFGVGLGLVAQLARASGCDDYSRIRRLIGTAAITLTLLGVATTLILWSLSSVLPLQQLLGAGGVPQADLTDSARALALAAGLGLPASLGLQIQIGLQRGAQVVAWSVGEGLMTLSTVSAAGFAGAPLWTFVLLFLGTPAAVRTVQSVVVLSGSRNAIRPGSSDLHLAGSADLFKVSFFFLVMAVAAAILAQAGVLIVGHLRGSSLAAELAVTIRLFAAVSSTVALAGRQFWPAASEAIVRGEGDWVILRFHRMLRFALLWSSAGSLLTLMLAKPIISVWVGRELVPDVRLLMLAALWTVYSAGMSQIAFLLNAAHVIREQIATATALTIGNLALCWYLTAWLGIYGPYSSALLAHLTLTGLPAIYLTRRQLRKLRPKISR